MMRRLVVTGAATLVMLAMLAWQMNPWSDDDFRIHTPPALPRQ